VRGICLQGEKPTAPAPAWGLYGKSLPLFHPEREYFFTHVPNRVELDFLLPLVTGRIFKHALEIIRNRVAVARVARPILEMQTATAGHG
jgi:hypothetical protein